MRLATELKPFSPGTVHRHPRHIVIVCLQMRDDVAQASTSKLNASQCAAVSVIKIGVWLSAYARPTGCDDG